MTTSQPNLDPPAGRLGWLVVAVAVVYPTILTWAYFIWLADRPSSIQQLVYATGKALQFVLPILWVAFVLGERPRLRKPSRFGLQLGLAFGLLVFTLMLALYWFGLKPFGYFEGPVSQAVLDKIQDLGIATSGRLLAVGVFYSLGHSFLEEYYWRWFVFGQLRRYLSVRLAITISSLGFMTHHVLLLAEYFSWASPLTYLFSASVAIGGAFWAWLYHRTGDLWGAWLSHLLIDAAIFTIGYDLARAIF